MSPAQGDEPVPPVSLVSFGSRVGPYRLVRRIGSGGMGEVFEAEEEKLGQRVALKRLHPHFARSENATLRFLREGRAVARIRHPHVVQVFTLGEDQGTPYLAMELLDGEDLSSVLERERRLAPEAALDLILPVVAGVSAAHEAGVIHRDLKPSNVFLTRGPGGTPWPKVIDFGISKLLAGDGQPVTDSGHLVGTAAYMAPEYARALKNASFLSDQYSLAVVLYECLTGVRPFAGEGVVDTLHAVMTAPVVPPSTLEADVLRELDGVILRALQRDPARRFPTLHDFGSALIPFASASTRATWGEWFERNATRSTAGERGVAVSLGTIEVAPANGTLALTRTTAGGRPRGTRFLLVGSVLAVVVVASVAALGGRKGASAPADHPTGEAATSLAAAVVTPQPLVTGRPSEPAATAQTAEAPSREPPSQPAAPAPSATQEARTGRARGHVPDSAAHARPPSSAPSSQSPRLGDNDAPILP